MPEASQKNINGVFKLMPAPFYYSDDNQHYCLSLLPHNNASIEWRVLENLVVIALFSVSRQDLILRRGALSNPEIDLMVFFT